MNIFILNHVKNKPTNQSLLTGILKIRRDPVSNMDSEGAAFPTMVLTMSIASIITS